MMKFMGYVMGIACVAVTNLTSAATVSFEPSVKTVNVGDMFSLAIVGDFVENIAGGGFYLNFDSAVLKLNGKATIDPIWEFAPDGGTAGASTLSDVSFNSFLNTHSGKFNIATLTFTALAPKANSEILLFENSALPFADADQPGQPVPVTFTSASVTVVQGVPLPSALLLLSSGIGAGAIKKRRRNSL